MRLGTFAAVLLIAVAVAAPTGCKQITGADPVATEDALAKAAPCTMSWMDILAEFKKNGVRFEKETFPTKLQGTKVEWTGEVESIASKYVKLDLDGATGADVELYLPEADIMKINDGERVKFEGVITDWTKLSIDGFMLQIDGKIKK